jgi:hypothetical protein
MMPSTATHAATREDGSDAVAEGDQHLFTATTTLGGAIRESVEFNKRLGLAYLNAYERAALGMIDAHEQMTATSDIELVRSTSAARACMARDATFAFLTTARRLLR